MAKAYHVYLLRCSDDSLYCGITTNLDERLKTHNEGNGSRYTRSRLPVELVYWEEHSGRSAATKREMEIKGWSRKRKQSLLG